MGDYCGEVTNMDLRIDVNDIEPLGFGNRYEWYPLDEIEMEVEIENQTDEDVSNIEIDWCLYDILENECVITGNSPDFDLIDGDEDEILVTFLLDPRNLNEFEYRMVIALRESR